MHLPDSRRFWRGSEDDSGFSRMSARGSSDNGASSFVFSDDYSREHGKNGCYATTNQDFTDLDGRLSIASRKAEELENRMLIAASWLQEMVGPLQLSVQPSEEELRLCLRNGLVLCRLINRVHPGAVLKIVGNPSPTPSEGALSAYQYFENVRNFLLAAEALEMPTFEASDLEETILVAGSLCKVVDCVLALKSYHEWKLSGGIGQWKRGVAVKAHHDRDNSRTVLAFSLDEAGRCSLRNSSANSSVSNNRKRFILPDVEFLGETELLLPDEPADLAGSEAMSLNHEWKDREDKFSTSACSLNGIEIQSPRFLSSAVRALLNGKRPDEVPMVVEFMLQKVVEDYRRRFLAQGFQLKKLRSALKEAMTQGPPKALSLELLQEETENDEKVVYNQLQLIKVLKEALRSTRSEVFAMKDKLRRDVEQLEMQLRGLAAAAGGYQRVLAENRRLYNEVQDLKGNIRVYCRVRPLLTGGSNNTTVQFIGENGEIMISNPGKKGKDACRTFNFNKVFKTSVSQEEVFLDTQPLIRSVLDGYNVCIFAYGQTGSGKTFTMSGPLNPTEEFWGVNYRALNDLFLISESRKDIFRYEIGVQMVEIYNEQVRDLLASDGPSRKVEIRSSSQQNGSSVPGAVMLAVTSTHDVLELMKCGQKNRASGATALNERSSRSHSVLTIHVQGEDLVSGSTLRGCLHLIDLAGSERVNKSEATGDRLKEAQYINRSLSALGDVIAALSQKSAHVPYRNSKLTQLLQDSLGGQAKTMMFVHVNPDVDSYGETMSTLKFAERVASIELGAARANKETTELRELKEQVMVMKDSLSKKDADFDRLLLLRNVKSEMGCAVERQRREAKRQSLDENEPKTRKQLSEGVKAREGSPPARERGRRFLSPPGNYLGFSHRDFDRLLSPPRTEDMKKKHMRTKQAGVLPKSPVVEVFAPRSPYRERQTRVKSRSRAEMHNNKSNPNVVLVDSPPNERMKESPPSPCHYEGLTFQDGRLEESTSDERPQGSTLFAAFQKQRLDSPDVDGLIDRAAALSRHSPVLFTESYSFSSCEPTFSGNHETGGVLSAEDDQVMRSRVPEPSLERCPATSDETFAFVQQTSRDGDTEVAETILQSTTEVMRPVEHKSSQVSEQRLSEAHQKPRNGKVQTVPNGSLRRKPAPGSTRTGGRSSVSS